MKPCDAITVARQQASCRRQREHKRVLFFLVSMTSTAKKTIARFVLAVCRCATWPSSWAPPVGLGLSLLSRVLASGGPALRAAVESALRY